MIGFRLDSLAKELSNAESGLAYAQDRTTGLVYNSGYLSQERHKRKVAILNEMYLEAVRTYETAKMSLLQNTPIVQIIDSPFKPLYPQRKNAKSAALIGFFVSLIVLSLIIIIYFIIRNQIRLVKMEYSNG